MKDQLATVLRRAEARDPVFSGDEVIEWPTDATDDLAARGLLLRQVDASMVVCDACESGHVEDVIAIESPPGTGVRRYIRCPEVGRVEVPHARVQVWKVDLTGLATAIARSLSLSMLVETVVAGRLWMLGRTGIGGRVRDVFLVRGMAWPDAVVVLSNSRRFKASRSRVVLVLGALPSPSGLTDEDTLVPVDAIVSFDNGQIVIDRSYLDAQFEEPRRRAKKASIQSLSAPPGTTWRNVWITITDHDMHVDVEGGGSGDYPFQTDGFHDRKSDRPNRLWNMLKLMAQHGGLLTPARIPRDDDALRQNLRQYASQLGKALYGIVPIEGIAVPYSDGWAVCDFNLRAPDDPRFPTPDGATWTRVSIHEESDGVISVSVEGLERFRAFDKHEEGKPATGAVAQGLFETKRCYDLMKLGLMDAGGQIDPRGVRLLDVLRGGRRVNASMYDDDLLHLNAFLQSFLGIETPPFEFKQPNLWIASFGASSYRRR